MKYLLFFFFVVFLATSCQPDHSTRPAGFEVFGVDLSRYQSDIDFDTIVGQNIQFIFVKATEGRSYIDPFFANNWDESARVGLRRGAYHFFSPNVPARQQAAHFVRHVKLEQGDLPPVLDFEVTGNQSREQIVENLTQWIDVVEKNYGIKPIIYTNYKLYNKFIAGTFDQYPIWIAKYGEKTPYLGAIREWQFWQYDNKAQLNGIKTPIDMNVFNGTLAELDSLCISTQKTKSPAGTISDTQAAEVNYLQPAQAAR